MRCLVIYSKITFLDIKHILNCEGCHSHKELRIKKYKITSMVSFHRQRGSIIKQVSSFKSSLLLKNYLQDTQTLQLN
jgi:hypothetical protein